MKKILSVLVVFSLLLIICIPAFAGTAVDTLTDAQQKEIATLVLKSVAAGNDPATVQGRVNISNSVISGISDFTPYKTAYNNDAGSITTMVAAAVNAVKTDSGFSVETANMLTTMITTNLINTVAPTTTSSSTTTTEAVTADSNTQYIVDFLSTLQYNQIEKVIVSLIGNNVITVAQAKSIINTLYLNGKITADQKASLLKAIVSDEASTNAIDNIFKGYTPTDLSQLFRGFGDSISTMSKALANLFRSANNGSGTTTTKSSSSSSGTNGSDIPATGDYAIPAVAAVALAAGLALVLTKKKKDS